ncbi:MULTISPECIES: hypothetical protein [Pontibacillus]|uniref:VOC domain-containing protein n=1 Tax=Pontibacillus chungwhensis TaxID=265426 RepID=A0ABY8UU30_9BACI|nr:hypothetical protein [Pontibacillus chungwhensis]MCD5323322.1 hypothetical protein [Pontibacillus sp. HN14]WIF96703.1 hypothetical protein QNI29_13195 [Pontibacillus chungwhensis]
MQLFHYHWWMNQLEEMENFYKELGFQTRLRVGNDQGEMQTFNPPLEWDDFRERGVTFRIIEMVKGQTNVTFGYGKKDRFDHIGILVEEGEYKDILQRAEELNLHINEGERRTFISTPWKFRIELQRRTEVVEEEESTLIHTVEIGLPFAKEHPKLLAELLNLEVVEDKGNDLVNLGNGQWNIMSHDEDYSRLITVHFIKDTFNRNDPVGTRLIGHHSL